MYHNSRRDCGMNILTMYYNFLIISVHCTLSELHMSLPVSMRNMQDHHHCGKKCVNTFLLLQLSVKIWKLIAPFLHLSLSFHIPCTRVFIIQYSLCAGTRNVHRLVLKNCEDGSLLTISLHECTIIMLNRIYSASAYIIYTHTLFSRTLLDEVQVSYFSRRENPMFSLQQLAERNCIIGDLLQWVSVCNRVKFIDSWRRRLEKWSSV